MHIIPLFAAAVVSEALIKRAKKETGKNIQVRAVSPLFTEYFESIVFSVLVAPVLEESVFRGFWLLVHPYAIWFGTLAWALAHPFTRFYRYFDYLPNRVVIPIIAILSAGYLSAGAFLTIVWLRGLPWGVLAVAFHALHNGIIVLSSLIQDLVSKRREKRPLPEPVPLPQPVRRVLRRGGEPTSQRRRVIRLATQCLEGVPLTYEQAVEELERRRVIRRVNQA